MQSKLKILFIDDHNGLREGMIFLLKNKNPSFEISGVSNVEEGIEVLSKDKDFSLVILDLNLDGENSLEKIPAIKKANPKVSVLVYTMYNSEHQVANAVRCDIQGFITKESAVEELEQAIVAISKGNTYFNNVASKVINSLLPSKNEKHNIKDEKSYLFDNYKSLSKKEKEIFIYLAKGLDIYEIVKLLGKSEKTILNQRTAIYHKMFVQDRHDLIEKAKLLGVIF